MRLNDSTSDSSDAALMQLLDVSVFYNRVPALQSVSLTVPRHQILGLIGPSGCGKSSLLRCLNRMHEMTPSASMSGRIVLDGRDLHQMEPVEVRRRIGMVFQRPNPFPRSIYDNIALGLRVNGFRGNLDARVELALKQVGLWDEVSHKLRSSALDLSGGQQQRLCIARAIALSPEIILMDEPCAALDPRSTSIINDLLVEMRQRYTIIIATHNLQQAARVTDQLAFFNMTHTPTGHRVGFLVECNSTIRLFQNPTQKSTWEYIYSNAQHFPLNDPWQA